MLSFGRASREERAGLGCIFLPGALDKGRLKRARVPASPSCFGVRLCRACQPAPQILGFETHHLKRGCHTWCVVGAPCARAMLSTVFCGTHRRGCRGCLSLFPNEFSAELDDA